MVLVDIPNLNLGLRTEMSCSRIYNLNVVGSETWFRIEKLKNPDMGLSCKSIKIDNSRSIASNLEFESVYEQGKPSILNKKRDFEDQIPFYNVSRISEKNIYLCEEEIHYLEERDEEILSDRMLNLSRQNKVRSAMTLYNSMKRSNLLPDLHACNSLLSCLIRNNSLDSALKIFESMRASSIISGHSYSLILKSVANARSSDEALMMFEEADNNHLDIVVYNTMISIFSKRNDWVQTEKLWRSLRKNHHLGTIITYRLLICTFVRCNQNELALDAYHEMVQIGLSPENEIMEAVIGACAKEGKWKIALDIFHGILNNGLRPSLVACNALINSLGKARKVEIAFKVYGVMKKLGHQPDAYTWRSLIGALHRADRHVDAIRLFESVKKEEGFVLNEYLYNACLMSCQSLGLWDKAMKILWEMEASGRFVSVTSYNLVIGACEVARKPKIGLEVYEHMVQQSIAPDVFTLLSLVRGCVWGSMWSKVEEILNFAPDGSLYNAAIQGMCLRRNTDLARKMYKKMREVGFEPDGKTRALMLQNLPKG